MCLVPGLADGRYLTDEEWLPAALAVDVGSDGCDGHGAHRNAGSPERGDEKGGLSRREVLARGGILAAGVAAAGTMAPVATARAATGGGGTARGDRIRMLGVNGGPVLSTKHSQPALQLIAGGAEYLVDCGGDTAQQIIDAGDGFASLRHLFLTHHHFDHTAGIPELMALGWTYDLAQSALEEFHLWGPPPIDSMVHHIKHAYALGAELFEVGIGLPPWAPIFHTHQYTLPRHGIVKIMEDENVIVHATRVFHGPEVHNAYAYRFDIKATGKAVAFSGDTAEPNRDLIALAQDVDVLVHEVQMNSRIPEIVAGASPSVRPKLRHHLETTHTDVKEVPRVAKATNAKRVVFCHYSLDPDVSAFLPPSKKVAGRIHYRGEILAPRELDEIAV